MITTVYLCATLAGGFSCLPMAGPVECAQAEVLLHSGVIIESECAMVLIAPGTIYAPDRSPIPVSRP